MLLKCCTQYASKCGKLSSGHRTGKVDFLGILMKGDFKECSATTQLHSSRMLTKQFLQASLQQHDLWNSICSSGFRKDRRTRDQIAICWIIEKVREFQKIIYFCFIDYFKAFDCVDHNTLEDSSRDGNTRSPGLPPEKSVCRSRNNR